MPVAALYGAVFIAVPRVEKKPADFFDVVGGLGIVGTATSPSTTSTSSLPGASMPALLPSVAIIEFQSSDLSVQMSGESLRAYYPFFKINIP